MLTCLACGRSVFCADLFSVWQERFEVSVQVSSYGVVVREHDQCRLAPLILHQKGNVLGNVQSETFVSYIFLYSNLEASLLILFIVNSPSAHQLPTYYVFEGTAYQIISISTAHFQEQSTCVPTGSPPRHLLGSHSIFHQGGG